MNEKEEKNTAVSQVSLVSSEMNEVPFTEEKAGRRTDFLFGVMQEENIKFYLNMFKYVTLA